MSAFFKVLVLLVVVLVVPFAKVLVLARLFEAVILLALSLPCFSASTDFVVAGRELRGTLGLVGAVPGRGDEVVLATPVVAALVTVVEFPVDVLLKVVGLVILVLVAVALSVEVVGGLGFVVVAEAVVDLSGEEIGLVVDVTLALLGLVAGLVRVLVVSFVAEVRFTSPFVTGFFSIVDLAVVAFVVVVLLRFEALPVLEVAGFAAVLVVAVLELVLGFGATAAGFGVVFNAADVLLVGVGVTVVVFALVAVVLVVLDTRPPPAPFSKTKAYISPQFQLKMQISSYLFCFVLKTQKVLLPA